MPELGKYAVYVLGAYGGVAVVLVAMVLVSLRASVRARRELERQEARGGRRRKADG